MGMRAARNFPATVQARTPLDAMTTSERRADHARYAARGGQFGASSPVSSPRPPVGGWAT